MTVTVAQSHIDSQSMIAAHIRADHHNPSDYDLEAILALAFEQDPDSGVQVPVVGPELFRHIIRANRMRSYNTANITNTSEGDNAVNDPIGSKAVGLGHEGSAGTTGRRSARAVVDEVLFKAPNAGIEGDTPVGAKNTTRTAFDSIVLQLNA